MTDDVLPGSVGQGRPLEGAELTVTSKDFTENLILGAIMGIAFQAAGAEVLDRTGIQGSFGAREAVRRRAPPGSRTRATAPPSPTRGGSGRRCATPT
jgi:hypothetical protein